MRDLLRQSNVDLLREIQRLREVLPRTSSHLPPELDTYYAWARDACREFHQRVTQNLQDLNLGQEGLLPDLLSSTQAVTRSFQGFNQRLVSPVLRTRPADRLCLKLLRWLHAAHLQTQDIPTGLSDGEFGIWPVPPLPTIYFMPCSAQYGLLYLPLFFHEFGHLLYACHKPEMDDLVQNLQEQIEALLLRIRPPKGPPTPEQERERSVIVETWYEWAQELFSDAVGYMIGGPAFLQAFSMYLRMRGRAEYHVPSAQLAHREHPVAWLRIRFLADRARNRGHVAEAQEIEIAWKEIAGALGVREDYNGFYDPQFRPLIQQTLDDMLTEAGPVDFTEQEPSMGAEPSLSPVALLNQAWQFFTADPRTYRAWEEPAITAFLA